jgi:beta-glucosidase
MKMERGNRYGIALPIHPARSRMGNFEWSSGFKQRFGIVYVGYESLGRYPKDSFYWYRDTIAGNRLNAGV